MNAFELSEKRQRLQAELDGLKPEYERTQDPGILERMNNLKSGIVRAKQEWEDEVKEGLKAGRYWTDVAEHEHFHGPEKRDAPRRARRAPDVLHSGPGTEAREAALRAVEQRSDELGPATCDRLDDVIERDRFGLDAAYIAAVADPAYGRAFFKKVAGMNGAEAALEADETEAMLAVGRAMASRAMAIGEGKLGGYGIPIQIDPSIILTSAGVRSPLREKARVVTTTTSEWKGVSSAGPSAHFHKEAEEAADDSFELAQPAIKAERADCFVPFSFEVGMDYVGFQEEIGRVMADAKNTLEGTKYTTGSGTNEPGGLVTGATETVETSEAGKLVIKDVYAVQEALPARFQENASWLTSLAVANATWRLVGGGNTTEPSLWNDSRDQLLMKPWSELSALDSKIETGKLVAVYGDLSNFVIVDRVGMSVELVPHLFGETRRPTGQRGLLAYWRTGSKVVNKAGLRVCKIK